MIRLKKPVKLLEWGEGTNTLNQIWSEIGEGRIVSDRTKDGITLLVIELSKSISKQNPKDNSIKIVQPGEGMTANSASWGEVAMGRLKQVESASGKSLVHIEIPTATKIDRRR